MRPRLQLLQRSKVVVLGDVKKIVKGGGGIPPV